MKGKAAKKERVIRDPVYSMERPSEKMVDPIDKQQRWFGKKPNPNNFSATGSGLMAMIPDHYNYV